MSIVKVDTLKNASGTIELTVQELKDLLDASGDNKGFATAWVVFDGAGVIKDSYNVNSVVKNSNGNYTITFNTPMDNANYAISGDAGYYNTSTTSNRIMGLNGSLTESSFTVITEVASSGTDDSPEHVSVVVHGGKN